MRKKTPRQLCRTIANPIVNAHAKSYVACTEPLACPILDAEFAMTIADAYDNGIHDPTSPDVKKSYDCLRIETYFQFLHVVGEGVDLLPWRDNGQPYASSHDLRVDVATHHRLYFFTGGDLPADHPLAEVSPISINDVPLTFNDLFRAVHDYFGHCRFGFEFGPRGEEGAYRSHREMFSRDAIPAMTTETRGQNCWVNFGPHMREGSTLLTPDTAAFLIPSKRPYAPQKALLLPSELCRVDARTEYRHHSRLLGS